MFFEVFCPHSLGTLIEWKPTYIGLDNEKIKSSPLAGDINWMETSKQLKVSVYLSSV